MLTRTFAIRLFTLSLMMGSLSATIWTTNAMADEGACTALGGNCICSQPFTGSAITKDTTNTFGWTPNNSTAKPCIHEGTALTRNHTQSTGPSMSNSSAILSALPSGHSVPFVLKMPDNYTGINEIGYNFVGTQATTNRRLSYRWYEYYSPDFQGTTGACLNSGKWFTMRPGFHESSYNPQLTQPLMYGWGDGGVAGLGWRNANRYCCNIGPGYDNSGTPDAPLQGRWWRYEVILRQVDGTPGAIVQAYRKNVTDNAVERRIIDTSVGCTGCGDSGSNWDGLAATALQPPRDQPLTLITTELFRNGTCAGTVAISHQMVAGWTTDAGQRIGAASEIESADHAAPAAPANLRISKVLAEE